ncbi:hypothetical protein SY88_04595 [Clostridiales bacterium PH28_bin88]|nr:hypothetical protein SY88_04595 [Clostridiales bacterium PH28_bin88]
MEAILLAPLVKPRPGYRLTMAVLALIVAWGLYAWAGQARHGLVVTGMRDQVFWGLYIATFVFFVSASLTGTLLSAILRITGYKWQVPITRLAEVITGGALLGAAAMIVADMGRPERLFNVFVYGRIQSPLIWDVIAISTYLTGSLIYLYLPMIPDMAICRDRLGNSVSPFRQKLYSILALGWQNTAEQKKRLEKVMNVMAVVIIPAAVSVHSVTAWIYAMTFRPGWNTTILAPYFVVSAFVSGVAIIIMTMTFYRKMFHLEKYITREQYNKLGWLLLALTMVYAYFSFGELLPGGYKLEGHERELLNLLFSGQQAPLFWFSIFGGIVVPVLLISWPKTRTVAGLTVAAILVTVAMWIKKSYLLVVPTLQVPLMPFYDLGRYQPTWAEWSITLAGIAGFLLLVTAFFRFFPAVAVWEVAEEWGRAGIENSGSRPAPAAQLSKLKGGA